MICPDCGAITTDGCHLRDCPLKEIHTIYLKELVAQAKDKVRADKPIGVVTEED